MTELHDDVARRTVIIERVFDCAPHHLFAAFSKPVHLMRFFGPPGYPLTTCEVDFRVGGRFRFAMTGPDGTESPPFGGTYLRIERPHEITYSNGFLDDGRDPVPEQQMMVSLSFVAEGTKTRLVMRTVFGSIAMHDEHTGMGFREGTNAGLDQLVAILPSLAAVESA